VAASLLKQERPIIDSGYAWLVSEANPHGDSDRAGGNADLLDKFDELVAGQIVAGLRSRGSAWSPRATGEVVLDALEHIGMLDRPSQLMPARDLVSRAHNIARQIVPGHAWNVD